jgi:predicted RNA-binding protein with EMAP domain
MNQNISFGYAQGSSCCTIRYKGLEFVGEAQCHPDDMDFESERTGLCIAEARATIKLMQFKRDYEIKPALQAIKHLHTNMQTSTKYNKKSYEAMMVYNQLKTLQKELDTINADINEERKYLKEYIDKKDTFHNRLRAKTVNI